MTTNDFQNSWICFSLDYLQAICMVKWERPPPFWNILKGQSGIGTSLFFFTLNEIGVVIYSLSYPIRTQNTSLSYFIPIFCKQCNCKSTLYSLKICLKLNLIDFTQKGVRVTTFLLFKSLTVTLKVFFSFFALETYLRVNVDQINELLTTVYSRRMGDSLRL